MFGIGYHTKTLHATYAAWRREVRLFFFGTVLFIGVQFNTEHGLFQLAAALCFQTGSIGFPGQIKREPTLAEHTRNAGVRAAHGQVGGFVGGLGGGELAQRDFEQFAALKVCLLYTSDAADE